MEAAKTNPAAHFLSLAEGKSDIAMGIAVVSILTVMVIPLPTMLLDILLCFNITFSLIIMLLSMYIRNPLELSAFPSILLLVTLFRLSLNIATTRLILLRGDEGVAAAGKVIMAFGNFVVGGNYVVGTMVFVILVVINFLVITKGAGRIAEVAARFTLDAMPGKQMSIDADLNAGIIDESEARSRRERIAREAEYYGSMDGANKFVRGDAVAGIIITLVNVIAGFAIGVVQHQMDFGQAAATYTLLTIGDGLVSQIPALIVSCAAGIVVTRAGTDATLGKEIGTQLLLQPRAIALTAAVLLGFALVPGLPTVPFFILAAIAGAVAYGVSQSRQQEQVAEQARQELEARSVPEAAVKPMPPLDSLAMEVGYGLIYLVDVDQDGELLDRIKAIRRQIAQDMGILIPAVHIQDNMQLKPGEYRISLKGNPVARGELVTGSLLAMDPVGGAEPMDGMATREPTYNLPAVWIKEKDRQEAVAKGYTVVDLPTVLITHLTDVVRRHAHELIGRQEVQQLLDTLKESHPKVVDELVPNLLSLGGVVKVLQNLLKEQVPIRDLLTICETLADWAPMTKDLDVLAEQVRQSLSRTITGLYTVADDKLKVITLDQKLERLLHEALQQSDQGGFLALEPRTAQKIMNALAVHVEKFASRQLQPIVMCSGRVRPHLKRLFDRFIPNMVVLAYDEILNHVQIQSLAVMELNDADQAI